MSDRERLTYDDFGRATRELAQRIADSGFEPDIVLSIARPVTTSSGAAASPGSVAPVRRNNVVSPARTAIEAA